MQANSIVHGFTSFNAYGRSCQCLHVRTSVDDGGGSTSKINPKLYQKSLFTRFQVKQPCAPGQTQLRPILQFHPDLFLNRFRLPTP